MKYILPSTLIIGILIGANVNIKTPEYLSVNFEDNHYLVEQKEPTIETAYAAEIEEIPQAIEPQKPEPKKSNKTEKCAKNYPETAEKIRAKFGEYGEYALDLYCRESSLNHKAINPTSGACGLTQSLPCAKMGCDLDDIDCQLAWGYNYIEQRYGNAQKALEFWENKKNQTGNGWY